MRWGAAAAQGALRDPGLCCATASRYSFLGSAPASTTDWVHLAFVQDGSVATFYVNGMLVESNQDSQPLTPTGHFSIAAGVKSGVSGSDPFNGNIDEMRVFTFAPDQFSVNDLLINAPPVPEPASVVLLGLGGLGLAGYSWRRRQLQRP